MTCKENAAPRGTFRLKVFKRGVLVEAYEDHNLIVNWTRNAFARLLSGSFNGAQLEITRIHIGTNGKPADGEDARITNPYTKNVMVTHPAAGKTMIQWTLGYDECNGLAVHEFGLITVNGSLFSRKVRESPLHKDEDIAVEGEWIIEF